MKNSVADSTLAGPPMDMTRRRRWTFSFADFSRWTRWITKGSLAVIDQGLISGSNFLISILLARWLSPEQYGAYALAFAIFLLVSFLHQALLLEPQKVFGSSIYRDCPRQYLGALLFLHAALALSIFLVLGISAWLAHELARSGSLPAALAGLALAAPFILLFWLVRSALYVEQAPQTAAGGALIYCVLLLVGLLFVFRWGLLSPFTAFVVMGLNALVASVFLLIHLRPALRFGNIHLSLKSVSQRHWEYGRWVLASLVLGWISADIYYPLTSILVGIPAAGSLKALFNLGLPVAQTCNGLSQLFLPYGARIHARDGGISIGDLALRITFLFAGGAVAYWTAIILFKGPVFSLLYGGKYIEVASLIPWIALGSVFANALSGPAIALRSMQSPASVFVASCASVVALAVGIPATWAFGLRGVVLGWTLSSVASFVVASIMLRIRRRAVAPAGA